MYPIEDNTYIDQNLITCVEYQLFIDEMRGQGQYYQPDHWNSYQFPKGQALEPILGIRHSDAVAFCEWLTKRDADEWKYRLPTQQEAIQNPVKSIEQQPLGYWISNEPLFAWIGSVPKDARRINCDGFIHINNTHRFDFSRPLDLAIALKYYPNRERDNNVYSALYNALIRDLDIASVALDLAQSLEHALLNISFSQESTLEFNQYLYNIRAIANKLASTLDRARDLELDLDRTRAHVLASSLCSISITDSNLAQELERACANSSTLARNLNIASAFDRDLALDRALDRALITASAQVDDAILDIIFDIITLQERIAGRSFAFEGIRIVKERMA